MQGQRRKQSELRSSPADDGNAFPSLTWSPSRGRNRSALPGIWVILDARLRPTDTPAPKNLREPWLAFGRAPGPAPQPPPQADPYEQQGWMAAAGWLLAMWGRRPTTGRGTGDVIALKRPTRVQRPRAVFGFRCEQRWPCCTRAPTIDKVTPLARRLNRHRQAHCQLPAPCALTALAHSF